MKLKQCANTGAAYTGSQPVVSDGVGSNRNDSTHQPTQSSLTTVAPDSSPRAHQGMLCVLAMLLISPLLPLLMLVEIPPLRAILVYSQLSTHFLMASMNLMKLIMMT